MDTRPIRQPDKAMGLWRWRLGGLALPLLLALAGGCAGDQPVERAAESGPNADLIFHGGAIVTVDPTQPEAQALAVKGGVILAVGDEAAVMKTRGPATKMVNLAGHTLMPGFVEPYGHLIGTAIKVHLATVDLAHTLEAADGARTNDRIVAALKAALPRVPRGGWLTGFGVDPTRATPFMSAPTAADLDRASTDVPIFLLNQSDLVAYVNHKALELAGVTANTPNPPGGVYVKSAGDQLTGRLDGPPTFAPFLAAMPPPASAQMVLALRRTYAVLAAAGVTTAAEIGLGQTTGVLATEKEWLERMAADPGTPVRVRAYLHSPEVARATGLQPGAGDDRLRIIGVSLETDGTTQSQTAALTEPYRYPEGTRDKGAVVQPDTAALAAGLKPFVEGGWQLAVRADGDAAIDHALDLYGTLLGGTPAPARRHRIERFAMARDNQVEQVRALGLTPTLTVGSLYFWGSALEQHILGPTRARRLSPAASLRNHNIRFALSGDAPLMPVSPLRSIATAVSRLPQGTAKEPLGPDQRISVDDAIRAATLDAAYQLFLDDKVGSLEVGKWADLVILDRNPRSTPGPEIMRINVLETYLGGKHASPVETAWLEPPRPARPGRTAGGAGHPSTAPASAVRPAR